MDANELFEELQGYTNDHENHCLDPADAERFIVLLRLAGEVGELNLRDATFIPEDDFTDYAKELHDGTKVSAYIKDDQWPYNHIDWDLAADELRHDYNEVDFEGVTYLYRDEH